MLTLNRGLKSLPTRMTRLGSRRRRAAGAPVDPLVKRLAHRLYGAGNNSGAAPLTGDGTAKTYSATFVNDSGAPIEKMSVVFQGWTLRTTGTTDTGNDFTVTGNIEYPVGGTTTDIGSVVVTNGLNVESAELTAATVIPPGASFKVNYSSTVPNAAKYIANLGFAGVRVHALQSTLKKEALYAVGDSIMTNNNGIVHTAAAGKCPAYHASISGTTARTYGENSAANFVKQVDLAKKLGITRFVSNFGTNDFGASTDKDTLLGFLQNMRSRANTENIKFTQGTMLPRTSGTTASMAVSSLTSSGNVLTAVVADASKFVVGKPYRFAGAAPAEYSIHAICQSVDVQTNTLTFTFNGSATPTATGTITILPWKTTSAAEFQAPWSPEFAAGPESARALFNDAVRSGIFDDYVEFADACEPSRNAGRWKIGGEDPLLPDVQTVTVSSVISTSRFITNYTGGSSTLVNGYVQVLTGTHIGLVRNGNGNTNGDITCSTGFPSNLAVGNQAAVVPGVSYMSDDGTHPRVAGGNKGGQAVLNKPMADKIDVWLA